MLKDVTTELRDKLINELLSMHSHQECCGHGIGYGEHLECCGIPNNIWDSVNCEPVMQAISEFFARLALSPEKDDE